MKRIIALVFVFVLMLSMAGCGNSNNQYTSKITTSNSPHSITFEIDENKINVSGTFKTDLHKYLLVFFDKDNSDECKIKVVDRSFNGTFELPNKKNMLVELYGGKEEFGNFESIILDYIKVEQVGDKWCFVKSPVLENNKTIFNEKKNSADYIGQTEQIQSEDSEIIELSKSITLGINDDYDKARAIHDWVATNIYYDFDALSSGNYSGMDAKNVLITKKGVCEGYANLVAALLRCQNIPCRIQSGYALGIDTNQEWNTTNISTTDGNHAWNEVYVNGEWIIIDATWDSQNKYKDGRYEMGNFITDIYYDSTLEFFSLSHKLIKE